MPACSLVMMAIEFVNDYPVHFHSKRAHRIA